MLGRSQQVWIYRFQNYVDCGVIKYELWIIGFFLGGARLVFIWPQKASRRGRIPSILASLLHGILISFLLMDALHIWPGEFLPNFLPSTMPPPRPPVKCNVIEPRWFDNSWGTTILYVFRHSYTIIKTTKYDQNYLLIIHRNYILTILYYYEAYASYHVVKLAYFQEIFHIKWFSYIISLIK